MFETFNTPAMYVAIQAVLSLYASGRTTGGSPAFQDLAVQSSASDKLPCLAWGSFLQLGVRAAGSEYALALLRAAASDH